MKRRRRRRRGPGVGVAVALGLALAIVGLVALSPRHRVFLARFFGDGPSASSSIVAHPRAPSVAHSAPAGSPRASARPHSIEPTERATPVTPPGPPREPTALPARSSPRVAAVPQGRAGEAEVRVRILDEVPAQLRLPSVPPHWDLREFTGRAEVEVVRDNNRPVLRLASRRSSFTLYRDVVLDVREFPWLRWSWKVTRLPTGGDVRERRSDDQAGQLYVIFPRWPFPRIHSDVLGYIWDSEAPVGLRVTSSQATNVKLVVLQSGRERLGQWIEEERNVYRDYLELFGKDPPKVGKVALMIDANDTGTEAEVFLDELVFRRVPRLGGAGARPRY